MLILSHRGTEYSPNSLEALNSAMRRGFSLETDLRLSKDGKIIIIHDKNLKDMFDLDIDINELNYKKLINTDSKFVDLIPNFGDFVKNSINVLRPGQVIALHIKDFDNWDLIRKTCEIITKYELEKKVFIFDILLSSVEKIKENYPKCKIGVSVGEKNYGQTIYTLSDIKPYIQFIDIIWADEWEKGLYTKDFFDYCEKAKKNVYLISSELHGFNKHHLAHSPETLWKNISPFVFSGICTDLPEKARSFFEANLKIFDFL